MAGKNTTAKSLTKSETYQRIATETGKSRKEVSEFFDALSEVIKKELSKKGPGVFQIPGLLKLKRVDKPAVKAHMGVDRFSGEERMFKAKPASVAIRARALKKLKDMVK